MLRSEVHLFRQILTGIGLSIASGIVIDIAIAFFRIGIGVAIATGVCIGRASSATMKGLDLEIQMQPHWPTPIRW